MKGGVLMIYENSRMERCQNSIKMEDILEVRLPNPERPTFLVLYSWLNRKKELKLKAESAELCGRWIYSIEMEMKRLWNDKKMKSQGQVKIKSQKNVQLLIDYH